jgi:hypothetical protein
MRILIVFASLALVGGGSPAPAQTGALPQAPPGPATSSIPSAPLKAATAGKEGPDAAMADCMRLWDKGTHMTKDQWARTCKRIQTRLDNLKIENLDMKGLGIRKLPGTAPQGRIESRSRAN